VTFTKRLREPVMRGEITCSVRIWQHPHVKVGGHYELGDGFIEVTSIRRISLVEITPELARRSGFLGVVDLLKVAKHGSGENVYLIDFEYHRAAGAQLRDSLTLPQSAPGSPRPRKSLRTRRRRSAR